MQVNEMLDQAYKAVEVAKDNAKTAKEAIRQRDELLSACRSVINFSERLKKHKGLEREANGAEEAASLVRGPMARCGFDK